ncbi:MAG: HEPN domain-containing protein [Moritella sp.]|uniref:HEPN domain-containing protein n=1 Tax=Moritella sp. TaxID=78556 RepID=UPI001DF38CC1|nr:HEPN domain-containing protein [Moritella sp.]NQZ51853.1 HEPN domain-containing protein [Moritella sp.]
MQIDEMGKIVSARIEDAEVLLNNSRFDGSVYLCGYAVELGLKAKICHTLQWKEYPSTGKKYQTFKTHDLDVLLHLTGVEEEVKLELFAEWSIVAQWNPEARYNPIGNVNEADAKEMLESTKELIKQL